MKTLLAILTLALSILATPALAVCGIEGSNDHLVTRGKITRWYDWAYEERNLGVMAEAEICKQQLARAGKLNWCGDHRHQNDQRSEGYFASCAWRDNQLIPAIRERLKK